VLVAAAVMLLAAGTISSFVNKHPTLKILALSFLLLIGTTLIMEGLHRHIPKGYVYFAMGFSVFVEALNLRVRKHREPVQIHQPVMPGQAHGADGRAPDTGRKAAASVD
jgi:predicted tellurium resistance membrane protein TerC